MADIQVPDSIADFLACRRIAVAGVSRDRKQPANAIFRRLRDTGHEVFAINPRATDVEGVKSHRDLASIPEEIDAVMIVTKPEVAVDVVHQAVRRGITRIWIHRSFGDGSVSAEALAACVTHGVKPIVGGCPMMFAGNVDIVHRCMRWWLTRRERIDA